jgi:hypothetical protein
MSMLLLSLVASLLLSLCGKTGCQAFGGGDPLTTGAWARG